MLLSLSLFAVAVASSTLPRGTLGNGWAGKEFQSLVTFGDSYTDEQRISYFAVNNGTAPPVGWIEPAVCCLCSSNVLLAPAAELHYMTRISSNYCFKHSTNPLGLHNLNGRLHLATLCFLVYLARLAQLRR
jgi:hypothetical protein